MANTLIDACFIAATKQSPAWRFGLLRRPRNDPSGHLIQSHGVHGAGFHLAVVLTGSFVATMRTCGRRRRLSSVRKKLKSDSRSDFAQENRLCGVLSMPFLEPTSPAHTGARP